MILVSPTLVSALTAAGDRPCPPAVDWVTAAAGRRGHLADALVLELRIADGEHLVNDEDFRFQMGCHCESQSNIHP